MLWLVASFAAPTPPVLPRAFSATLTPKYADDAKAEHLANLVGAPWPSYTKTFHFDNSTADGTLRQRLNGSTGFNSTSWKGGAWIKAKTNPWLSKMPSTTPDFTALESNGQIVITSYIRR